MIKPYTLYCHEKRKHRRSLKLHLQAFYCQGFVSWAHHKLEQHTGLRIKCPVIRIEKHETVFNGCLAACRNKHIIEIPIGTLFLTQAGLMSVILHEVVHCFTKSTPKIDHTNKFKELEEWILKYICIKPIWEDYDKNKTGWNWGYFQYVHSQYCGTRQYPQCPRGKRKNKL